MTDNTQTIRARFDEVFVAPKSSLELMERVVEYAREENAWVKGSWFLPEAITLLAPRTEAEGLPTWWEPENMEWCGEDGAMLYARWKEDPEGVGVRAVWTVEGRTGKPVRSMDEGLIEFEDGIMDVDPYVQPLWGKALCQNVSACINGIILICAEDGDAFKGCQLRGLGDDEARKQGYTGKLEGESDKLKRIPFAGTVSIFVRNAMKDLSIEAHDRREQTGYNENNGDQFWCCMYWDYFDSRQHDLDPFDSHHITDAQEDTIHVNDDESTEHDRIIEAVEKALELCKADARAMTGLRDKPGGVFATA